ncbi:MAG: RNA polymerase sigma factor [Ardenticatenaceae bacterium]
MSEKPLLDSILSLLTEASTDQQWDDRIRAEMWPALAQALERVIGQYIAQKGALPDPRTFRVMVHNFNQDGPRVQALLRTRDFDEEQYWQKLRQDLERQVGKKWPFIGSVYREEIADRAWIRIHKSLPNFLFLSRFSTWGTSILLREYLRLKPKWERDRQTRSLDEPNEAGWTLADTLLSHERSPEEVVTHKLLIEDLWKRLEQLYNGLDLKILRLHLEGYKLAQIQEQLGEDPISVSTIWRRLDRIKRRLRKDKVIHSIAEELGISAGLNFEMRQKTKKISGLT